MEKILEKFVERSREILQDDLTGIYLHGSAVMGCYNPQKSDLDLIIVVDKPLQDDVKLRFMDMVTEVNEEGLAKGIEMSIVTRNVCDPFIYPTPFELHFSVMHLEWYKSDPRDYVRKMKGTDKDLAAHFTIIGKRGKCLYGLPVEEVFATVPQADYMDSIREDIANAGEDIFDNTMYITLNLARVLAFKKEGSVISKKEGGEWALENVPEEYHDLVKAAMREYAGAGKMSYDYGIAERYAEYMLKDIENQENDHE
ncbi:MAG: DUF4111 domain-containing protein [Lachnospiraceae bacterium]|nr:DUF4111 domain-containing protein [Lachnospiraceae bacterium]